MGSYRILRRWRGKKKWLLNFLRSIFKKHAVCFEGYAIDDKVGPGNICTNKFTTVSETDPLGGIGNHPQGVRHDYFQKLTKPHLWPILANSVHFFSSQISEKLFYT